MRRIYTITGTFVFVIFLISFRGVDTQRETTKDEQSKVINEVVQTDQGFYLLGEGSV